MQEFILSCKITLHFTKNYYSFKQCIENLTIETLLVLASRELRTLFRKPPPVLVFISLDFLTQLKPWDKCDDENITAYKEGLIIMSRDHGPEKTPFNYDIQ